MSIKDLITGKKMNTQKLRLSKKGEKLLELYKEMVKSGYTRSDDTIVKNAYNDFELKKFRQLLLPYFEKNKLETILDYGCGGSDWGKKGFDDLTNKSAKEFFSIKI